MLRGYDRRLYIFPFDHRSSCEDKMSGGDSPLSDAQTIRPRPMIEAIQRLKDSGVAPDLWKVERRARPKGLRAPPTFRRLIERETGISFLNGG
jgi:myo-inositol catabolism protein IolC